MHNLAAARAHALGESAGHGVKSDSPGRSQQPPWPSLQQLQERAAVVSLPLHTKFRGITERELVIFKGEQRSSEFAAFPEYAAPEAANWLRAAIEYGWHELPPLQSSAVSVNATIPAVSPAQAVEILAKYPGCDTVKVKVCEPGQQLDADINRVAAVREALGQAAKIRVDANGGWGVDAALTALRALAVYNIDYAEQPCRTVRQLRQLRLLLHAHRINIKIAADESVRKASDPLRVARAGAADLLVIKAAPLGGISSALRITAAAGLPVVVSSALDSSAGIAMGAHLACALPPGLLYGACGLGTMNFFAADITAHSKTPDNGIITADPVTVDPQLLLAHRAAPAREKWWRQRITDCYTLLESFRKDAAATPN